MADWITKLDDFLRLSEREILTHAGKISHEQAVEKAEIEFERYRQVAGGIAPAGRPAFRAGAGRAQADRAEEDASQAPKKAHEEGTECPPSGKDP